MDRRQYNIFQSAVKAVSEMAWIETEGKDQEHQACYDETCDDKMTSEKTQTRMLNSFLSQRCDVGKWCATVTGAKTR